MIVCSELELKGVLLFESKIFEDSRGSFSEAYNSSYSNYISKEIKFIQDNESVSRYGVLRGLHFQNSPFEQSKLVRVSKGEIQDIIVDIRRDSSTFGKYISILLSKDNGRQVFVPKGFAHGFLTLSKEAIVNYKVDNKYSKEHESGIIYNDKDLLINWKIESKDLVISDKDLLLAPIKDLK
tara:strand:+ start:47 stop:589 length:543 start_codon:yes stop_codon:yes gene_type:complete